MQPRASDREGGYAALWLVIALGLMALAGLAAASLDPDAEIPALWVAGCIVVVALGLVVEARHDLRDFCKFAGTFALIGAVGCGLVAGLDDEPHPLAAVGALALGVSAVAAFVMQYRLANAEEILPNALAELFDNSALSELGGVQFGVRHTDLEVPAGGELVVHVFAQNGMSEERVLTVRLRPRADIGKGGHLSFDKEARIALPAGAAGALSIPVAVHPKARGTYPITVEPSVKGSGGRRLRVYRARPFSQKISPAMQLVGLMFGFFVWGGGLTLKLKVAKNKGWKSMPVEEAAPSSAELLYEPDRALLEGIRMRV